MVVAARCYTANLLAVCFSQCRSQLRVLSDVALMPQTQAHLSQKLDRDLAQSQFLLWSSKIHEYILLRISFVEQYGDLPICRSSSSKISLRKFSCNMLDRVYMQDSVEERFKEQKAAAEEAVEPEVDDQGKPLNKKQRLQAKRAAEKERARQRQAAQGLMAPSVSLASRFPKPPVSHVHTAT